MSPKPTLASLTHEENMPEGGDSGGQRAQSMPRQNDRDLTKQTGQAPGSSCAKAYKPIN